ncbi:Condensin complex subunit 3 [Plecturocebus cupreus]
MEKVLVCRIKDQTNHNISLSQSLIQSKALSSILSRLREVKMMQKKGSKLAEVIFHLYDIVQGETSPDVEAIANYLEDLAEVIDEAREEVIVFQSSEDGLTLMENKAWITAHLSIAWFTDILRPLLRRATQQEKIKILLLIDTVAGHPRAMMEILKEINAIAAIDSNSCDGSEQSKLTFWKEFTIVNIIKNICDGNKLPCQEDTQAASGKAHMAKNGGLLPMAIRRSRLRSGSSLGTGLALLPRLECSSTIMVFTAALTSWPQVVLPPHPPANYFRDWGTHCYHWFNDDPADARKEELKMAEIKVKHIEAKEALENITLPNNIITVSLCSQGWSTVAPSRLTATSTSQVQAIPLSQPPKHEPPCPAKRNLLKEKEQCEIKEVHKEKNDTETLQNILYCELLKQMSISTGISAATNGIIEFFILPKIISVYPIVRNLAVLYFGATDYRVRILQVLQIDDVTIKISVLKAIFDQLIMFGVEPLKPTKIKAFQCESAEINRDDEQESFLDSEFSELRIGATEELGKLMFSGLLVSSRILSHLISPVTEEDVRLQHCLCMISPRFSYVSRINQECFEEVSLPSLHTLASAPAPSLAEIDITNALTIHDNLAIKICSEILTSPCSPETQVYIKALSSLELNSQLAKDLLLLSGILEQVKDRTCLKALEKIKIQGQREVTASARMKRRLQIAEADSESNHGVPEPEP